MEIVKYVLIALEVLASIALVLVVLMQTGKEAGLSGAVSGNSNSFMNQGKSATKEKKLAKFTKWTALVWIILTLVLSLI